MIKLTTSIEDYLRDESRAPGGAAEAVFLPETEAETAELLRACQNDGTPVTISGARTGIAGGAVPHGGIVVATDRLNRIERSGLDEASGEWRVTLGPGVSLRELQALDLAARANGAPARRRFFFPVDATEDSASLGGMAATNASGAMSFGFGAVRNYVRALRVVLAGGEILSLRRREYLAGAGVDLRVRTESGKEVAIPVPTYRTPPIKHMAGLYASTPLDAVDLFVGAEGSLGIITELELALIPVPMMLFGGLAFFPSEEAALGFVRTVRDEKPAGTESCRPVALEYFDAAALDLANRAEAREQLHIPPLPAAGAAVYFEQCCGEDEIEELAGAWSVALEMNGSSLEGVWSSLEEKDRSRLKSLRHLVPEEVNRQVGINRRGCPAVHKVGTDLAVPHARLGELFRAYRAGLAREDIPAVIFGHIGDDNLHVNMLPQDEETLARAKALHLEWAALAVSLGGTVAAEHGIGKLKRALLRVMYRAEDLAEMDAVKKALDPKGILCLGNGGFMLDREPPARA
ncbi:MAG: FAD-binding oxidoreductase [Patescibacteria group bacterium]